MTAQQKYLDAKNEIVRLVSVDNESTPVPATPAWTIHDLVAHLAGAAQDVTTGTAISGTMDEWTATHVERFRDTPLPDILAAWDQALADAGDGFAELGASLLPDIATHEFDIRGALGDTGNRDTDRLGDTLDFILKMKQPYFAGHNLPALRLQLDDRDEVLGEGEPQGTLTTSMFEASRVFTGRRSLDQVRALDWSSDPEPWVKHLSGLGQRDTDLIE